MHILVTGGAGFIGSTLVDRLLAGGHHVDVVDDLTTGGLANLADARRDGDGRLKIHQCDIRDDAFPALLARREPEVVVHLATCTSRDEAEVSSAASAAIDVVGTVQVVDGARAAGVRKIVTTGSLRAAVSTSIRAAARQIAVDLVIGARAIGPECTVIDLPTVFGPRQRPGREGAVVATFAERMAAGLPCVVHGDGEQTRDLLYVDDAVDALAKAIESGDGLRLAVGTGVQTSVNDLFGALAAVAGADAEAVSGARRDDEPGAVVADPSRAAIYLGWEPFTPLAEALTDTLVSVSG